MTNELNPSLQDLTITENDIIKLFLNLNPWPYRAVGQDTLTSTVLKEFSSDIAPISTTITRRYYEPGDIPVNWEKSKHKSNIKEEGKTF